MELQALLRGIEVRSAVPALDVGGLHYDSRKIEPDWAFFAVLGEVADGNNFVPQAVARGAAVVVSEREPPAGGPPWVRVANARRALAQASGNWFGRAGERLRLVGITGTNGKTTTAFLVERMLREAGVESGLLGTIEYHIGREVLPSPHTTPESYDLQQLLARMAGAACAAAVMEVSSHALAQDRVWGLPFEVAVFTNLTQDHLDYHHTMAAYAAAKRRLFEDLGAGPPKAAVVNGDDAASAGMVAGFRGRVLSYGFGAGAEVRASGLESRPSGLRFTLEAESGRYTVESPLLGRANALNLMAALATGRAMGFEWAGMVAGAARWPRVRGRFEPVFAGQPFTVLVDYAHTPDALANVLGLAREVTPGRVGVVFGCGGDRDRGKRPLMGRAAAAGADWAVVTSDNPRTEDPAAIIAAVLAGMPAGTPIEPDRRAAIREALRRAAPGDTVVIAGKGHEDYQIVGTEKLHLDDAEEARAALAELGWKL